MRLCDCGIDKKKLNSFVSPEKARTAMLRSRRLIANYLLTQGQEAFGRLRTDSPKLPEDRGLHPIIVVRAITPCKRLT